MARAKSPVWKYLEESKPLLPNQPASQPFVGRQRDGCEHGNSAYKWVQAGRVTLSDENARMIVYIILNSRMLKLYKALSSAERVKGGYRRCWGWPPVAEMGQEALKAVEAEVDPQVAALHAN